MKPIQASAMQPGWPRAKIGPNSWNLHPVNFLPCLYIKSTLFYDLTKVKK